MDCACANLFIQYISICVGIGKINERLNETDKFGDAKILYSTLRYVPVSVSVSGLFGSLGLL